jgi:hypothetical protein
VRPITALNQFRLWWVEAPKGELVAGAGVVPLISVCFLWFYSLGIIRPPGWAVDTVSTYLVYLIANVVEVSFVRVRAGQCPTCGARRKRGMPGHRGEG